MEIKLPVYNLEITSDLEDDVEVDVVSLVDRPAIERSFLMFKDDKFIDPIVGEGKDKFLPRCIAYVINEGKDTEQAVAICNSIWEEHFEEGMPHYTADGKLYEGPTHKNADGKLMTGATHNENSEYLYHKGEYAENSYNDYPEAAVNNAKRALKWAEENGWGSCGESTGKIRANQIANKENLTRETIARISGFRRHQQNKDVKYGEGCGGLMWDAWGGDAMIDWAERKLKQIDRQTFAIQDEEERIISGPLMLADTPIYRSDDNGEYYVVFTKETIKKIAQRFFKKGYQSNVNLMHEQGNLTQGLTMFESWIKDDKRGIKAMKGFEDVPDGSWFGSFKVDNDEVWQMVKDGKVRGFSVEGQFNYRKTGDKKMEQLWANVLEVLAQIG